jgi:multiple sugar transport system substrate-binding protein
MSIKNILNVQKENKMTRKKLLVMSAALLLSGATVFAQGSKEPVKQEGPVTISYYTWNDATHQALIDGFNATHTDIQVDGHILASADYETKLTTLLSGRADIDCFMEKRQSDMFNQADNSYLETLDDYIAAAGGNAAVDGFRSSLVANGQVVEIPWRGGAYFTYYNKKVFEKAGIPTPDTYVENGEWTWEKFEEVSNAIHDADSSLLGSTIYIWGGQGFFKAGQAGDSIVTPEGEVDNLSNVMDQLEMRKRLEDNGAMWKLVDMKVTKTHYSKQFYDGNVGMLIIGEWFPGQMITGSEDGLLNGFDFEDYGITRMPCNEEEYRTVGLSTGNCITTYSDKKDAAWEFINWMSGPEGAAIAASYGVLPAAISEEAAEIIKAKLPNESSAKYYLEPKVSSTANFSKYASRVETEFAKLQEDYMLGNITSAEFESKFNSVCEEIVKTTY